MGSEFSTDNGSLAYDAERQSTAQSQLDIKRMLRLRAPLIVGVSLVLTIASSAAIWFTTPTVYLSTVQLRFLASAPRVLQGFDRSTNATYDKFVNTQINLLTGPAILSRVVEDPKVRALPEIVREADPIPYLRQRVGAAVKRNSELVIVTLSMQDGNSAAVVLDKLVDKYLEYALGEDASADSERLRILMKERDNRRFELDSQLKRITELQQDIGIPLSNIPQLGPSETEAYRENFAQAMEDLSQSEAAVGKLERDLSELESLRAQFDARPESELFELGIEDKVKAHLRVAALRTRLVSSEASLAVLLQRFRPDSPQVVVEKNTYDALMAKVIEAEVSVRRGVLDSLVANIRQVLGGVRTDVAEAEGRRNEFRALIDDHDARAATISTVLAELEELKMRAEETRRQLRSVRETIATISIENQAPARVRRVTRATVPKSPDRSKLLQLLVLATAASLSVGFMAGLWRELTDQRARSAADLANATSLPILATIPFIAEDPSGNAINVPLVSAEFPDSPSADEYRCILSRIIYPSDDVVEVNTCLIASAMRGDGKTSLACNLALNLVQTNRSVLLIDICPRDPSVELYFGFEPSLGLAELLAGDISAHSAARATRFANLRVMGPGLHAEGLSGQLASREMMKFLEQAEEDYDHVIIDSPPALLMSDAKLLAPVVDGVIMVVGVETTTLGMARRCLRELDQANANLLGVVLNGIRPTRGGYLKSNLDLFHGYRDRRAKEMAPVEEYPEMHVDEKATEETLHPSVMLLGDSEEIEREEDTRPNV